MLLIVKRKGSEEKNLVMYKVTLGEDLLLLLLKTLVGFFHMLETEPLVFTPPLPFNSLEPVIPEKLNHRVPVNSPCILPKADAKAGVPDCSWALFSVHSLGQWFSATDDFPSSLPTLC